MVLGNKIVGRSKEKTKLTLGQEGISIPLRVLSGPQGRIGVLEESWEHLWNRSLRSK